MAVEYINRRGDTYYVHIGKTKTGKPMYYVSKKKDGVLAESIPDGYEIYEDPNARVYVRKIRPRIFTDEEIAIVENSVRRYSNLAHFKIDLKENSIVIFSPDQDFGLFKQALSRLAPLSSMRLDEILTESLTYSPVMRFVLADKESREFEVERWCFLGSIDDWIFLDTSNDLADLAKRYCRHLGRESFYELTPYDPA
jgi:hypothetical protein